ncbi:MAG TPA: acetamidase/formamidase family protein [Thermoplasmata archaeon]|nr:acetamidase/formamidase family protein [Thermoplasmata archaeon]
MTASRRRPVGPIGRRPVEWHTVWSARQPPIARIRSGDEILLDVPDASAGQLHRRSTRSDLAGIDHSKVDAAVGPFAVEGARPGDGLRLHLRDVRIGSWGWSAVFREFGLLRNRFDDDLVTWKIAGGLARPASGFLRPVTIPVRPMLGWLGTAPREGEHSMIPPRRTGGNMDSRLHGPGATILLPVEVPDALLSVGDPHAAMGDGEVCGTGIEAPARVRIRVELVPDGAPPFPRVEVPALPMDPGPAYVATGIGPDPLEAARFALEGIIDWLGRRGVAAKEAYLLASLVGHLRWSEAVDLPNHVVSMTFPSDLRWGPVGATGAFKPSGARRRRAHG